MHRKVSSKRTRSDVHTKATALLLGREKDGQGGQRGEQEMNRRLLLWPRQQHLGLAGVSRAGEEEWLQEGSQDSGLGNVMG